MKSTFKVRITKKREGRWYKAGDEYEVEVSDLHDDKFSCPNREEAGENYYIYKSDCEILGEHICSDCKFYELSIDIFPCSACSQGRYGQELCRWEPKTEEETEEKMKDRKIAYKGFEQVESITIELLMKKREEEFEKNQKFLSQAIEFAIDKGHKFTSEIPFEKVIEFALECDDKIEWLIEEELIRRVKEEQKPIDIGKLLSSNSVEVRGCGNLKDKAIYLNEYNYDWDLERDDYEILCLIPTRK